MGVDNYDSVYQKVVAFLNAGDWESALTMLKEGDARGESDSTCILAEMYLHGVGVRTDPQRAIRLFEKAMTIGNPHAAQGLGAIFDEGCEGIEPDEGKAFIYFSKGAEAGFPSSMGSLAYCYLWGVGTVVDDNKAFHYGQRAAKGGDTNGMVTVAICYYDGIGGARRDPYAAAHWYREALQNEEKPAWMYRLAICLSDPFEEFNFHPTQEMYEEAYFWASKAVDAGHVESHLLIAWFYETGNIVGRDYESSQRFLQIAADNGNDLAKDLLKRYRKNIYGQIYLPK